MTKGYVYRLYSDIDKKFYIGSCNNMTKRMDKHKRIPINKKVKEWYDKIGFENVKYEILKSFDNINEESLRKEEDNESKKYLRTDPNCLNVQRAKLSDEERIELDKKYGKVYREKNKDKAKKYQQEYYNNNKEKLLPRNDSYRQTHKEEFRNYNKKYRLNNKDKQKQYRENNKEKAQEYHKEYGKQYRLDNKERDSKMIECPLCGQEIQYRRFTEHQKSKTCLKNAMERLSV